MTYGLPLWRHWVSPQEGLPSGLGISVPPPETLGDQLLMSSPCSSGHRQKLEDQTKAFDRFGDLERLRMRVTPSTPSPRGSLSTTSHFSSQAQTPIQGTAPRGLAWGAGGQGTWRKIRPRVVHCAALVL